MDGKRIIQVIFAILDEKLSDVSNDSKLDLGNIHPTENSYWNTLTCVAWSSNYPDIFTCWWENPLVGTSRLKCIVQPENIKLEVWQNQKRRSINITLSSHQVSFLLNQSQQTLWFKLHEEHMQLHCKKPSTHQDFYCCTITRRVAKQG